MVIPIPMLVLVLGTGEDPGSKETYVFVEHRRLFIIMLVLHQDNTATIDTNLH